MADWGQGVAHPLRGFRGRAPEKIEAQLLQIAAGSPIHFMQSRAYLHDGRPIEYSRLRFRGDRSRISFEVKRAL